MEIRRDILLEIKTVTIAQIKMKTYDTQVTAKDDVHLYFYGYICNK